MSRPLIFFDPHPRSQPMVYTPDVEDELSRVARVVTHFGSRAPDALIEKHLDEMTILVGQSAMPKERLDRAPNLRAILNVKANWEPNIDYVEAAARGIHVLSAAPAMAPAVAEYCLGQAIALARGFPQGDRLFRAGQERYGIAGNQGAFSLYGASFGMIGFGNLGQALLPLLRPFGCEVAAHDPWLSDGYLRAQGVTPMPLDDLLSSCRVIFVLAGVTSENEGFLSARKLAKISNNSILILASRAEVVDFDALLAEAASMRFRAAIDVFPEEPVPAEARYRDAPNVLFTSHLAGGILASYERIREMMMDDIGQILKGLPPSRMQPAHPKLAAKMRSR